jgi:hypothetical protein
MSLAFVMAFNITSGSCWVFACGNAPDEGLPKIAEPCQECTQHRVSKLLGKPHVMDCSSTQAMHGLHNVWEASTQALRIRAVRMTFGWAAQVSNKTNLR